MAALTRRWRANLSVHGRSLRVGFALAGIVALGLAFRLGALDLPLDRDEGAYGYIGSRLFSGTVPYRDVFDHKPPGAYLFYALASLGPDKVAGVRLGTAVLFAASLLLVFTITARIYGRTAGLAAALAFVVLGNSYHLEAERANAEQIMLPLLLFSLWSFQKGLDGDSRRWLVTSGVAGGGAVLMKQVAVLPEGVLLAFLGLKALRDRDWRRPLGQSAAIAAGAALLLLATVIYFAAEGALGDMYYAVVDFNSRYVRSYWDAGLARPGNFDPIVTPWTYVALGSLFLHPLIPREARPWHYLIIGWSLANLAGAKMGLRDFPHYFVPVLPGIAILGGGFIAAVAERLAAITDGRRWLGPALALGVALGLFAWQVKGYADFYFFSTPAEMAHTEFGPLGDQVFAPAEDVASYVRASTTPGEKILVWAAEAEVYFLSGRPSASRYIYINRFDVIRDGPATMRSDLLTRRPGLVVTYTEDSPMYKPFRKGLYELLDKEGYRESFRAGWLAVYRRSGSPTP